MNWTIRLKMIKSIAAIGAVVMTVPVAAQYNQAPANQAALERWSVRDGYTKAMVKRDPASPVIIRGTTGPKYNAYNHMQAMKNIPVFAKVKFTGPIVMEKLDSWAKFDGRDSRIALVPTTIGGKPGTMFALIVRPRGTNRFSIWSMNMTTKTYREWGGAVRMLALRGVINNSEVFPKDMRNQIARRPHRQQLAFYEAALNKLYSRLAARARMSQSQQVLRMRELNYDLLFGGNISSPFIAD